MERHHPNSLHASCVHNTSLIALRYSGNACSTAVSLTSVVYLLFCSPLCLLLCFFLHSRKACTASSGPPNLRQRHWPREQRWEGRPLLTAAPPWHREAQLLLLAVFPTLVPGFPKWAVDAHSLSILVCMSQLRSSGRVNLKKQQKKTLLLYRPASSGLERKCWGRYFEQAVHGYK